MPHPDVPGSPPPSYIDVTSSGQYWDPSKQDTLSTGTHTQFHFLSVIISEDLG